MTETTSTPAAVAAAAAPSKDSGPRAVLGWALFLGMSWTWCIGMFAPVLLVRDYGLVAWFIFAIPNVVGAAAMGWVLARPGAADRVAWSHRGAGVFFSIITIAFHGFFIDWIIRGLVGWVALAITPALALAMVLVGRARRWADLALAGAVFLFSVGAIVAYAVNADGIRVAAEARAGSALDLVALSAASLFGFALCPYLDLTFLRARQATAPRAGALAFTIGFGVFFLLMIVFTLGYATDGLPLRRGLLSRAVAWTLAAHLMVQAALTIAFHWKEVSRRWGRGDVQVRIGTLVGVAGGALPLLLGPLKVGTQFPDPNENVYRLFMSFYALVFPAYVWLCMIPARGGRTAEPTRRGLVVLAAVVAIAGPMFWAAFLGDQMEWALPGLAVILLGRLFVRHGSDAAAAIAPATLGAGS